MKGINMKRSTKEWLKLQMQFFVDVKNAGLRSEYQNSDIVLKDLQADDQAWEALQAEGIV